MAGAIRKFGTVSSELRMVFLAQPAMIAIILYFF